MASLKYGVLIGIMTVVFMRIAPQPMGSMVYWGLIAVQASWFAIICWHRTRLPFATTAMVSGAAIAVALLVLGAVGHPFPDLPPRSWAPLGIGAGMVPTLLWIESRANAEKWRLWRERGDQVNVWSRIIGRHIPQLRNGGA